MARKGTLGSFLVLGFAIALLQLVGPPLFVLGARKPSFRRRASKPGVHLRAEGDEQVGPGFRSRIGDEEWEYPEHVKVPFPSALVEGAGAPVEPPQADSEKDWKDAARGPRFRTLPGPRDGQYMRNRGAAQFAMRSRLDLSGDVRMKSNKPPAEEAYWNSLFVNTVPKESFRAYRMDQRNRATEVYRKHIPYKSQLELSGKIHVTSYDKHGDDEDEDDDEAKPLWKAQEGGNYVVKKRVGKSGRPPPPPDYGPGEEPKQSPPPPPDYGPGEDPKQSPTGK